MLTRARQITNGMNEWYFLGGAGHGREQNAQYRVLANFATWAQY